MAQAVLSVAIETLNDEGPLAATLAALVPAAVEGLVREVVILDRGSSDGTLALADHAGCRVAAETRDLHAALLSSRGDWLLILEPGARPVDGWIPHLAVHLTEAVMGLRTPQAARFRRARGEGSGFWARFGRPSSPLADGLLLPRRQALALAKTQTSLADLAKGLATRRLAAEIRPRPAGSRVERQR